MKQLAWEKDIDLTKGAAAPAGPSTANPTATSGEVRGQQSQQTKPADEAVENRLISQVKRSRRTPSPAFRHNKVGVAPEGEESESYLARGTNSSFRAGKKKRRRKLRRKAKPSSTAASDDAAAVGVKYSGGSGEEGFGQNRIESSTTSIQSAASSRTSLIARKDD